MSAVWSSVLAFFELLRDAWQETYDKWHEPGEGR